MKIVEIRPLSIPAVKVIRFARFCDNRGYFTEPFRNSQFRKEIPFMKNIDYCQINESYSKPGVVRGLHFQWNPYMGKLVRTVQGRMLDLFLDIRRGSPTFGKVSAYEMISQNDRDFAEWIWIPPGFAHGNYFSESSTIEYMCSGEYSPNCEAGISPLSDDLDWSDCDAQLKEEFIKVTNSDIIITKKDMAGFTLESWSADKRSNNFLYKNLE